MLYYNFKNYEEFKGLFGIVEHGNGEKSRKNMIMLSLWKDKTFLHRHIMYLQIKSHDDLWSHALNRISRIENAESHPAGYEHKKKVWSMVAESCGRFVSSNSEYSDYDLLSVMNVTALRRVIYNLMGSQKFRKNDAVYRMELMDHLFYSNLYKTDDLKGLCEDGTPNAIRYINVERERVFKMRAGKMFENHLLSCNRLTEILPIQIKRMLTEDFVGDWITYSKNNAGNGAYVLHVDDNFEDIYSSSYLKGNFHSCMVGEGNWYFYRDSVKAKAAYLTDSDDMIVARCIIFTEVYDENGKLWRLAERQYSTDSDLGLQRMLISALIREGYIDGYKSVGASCSDSHNFVDIDGNSLYDVDFHIECNLEIDDALSYQDSFKYYDKRSNIAYNDSSYSYDFELDTTAGSLEDNHCWSDYNQEYINSDEAYYVETRDDYFYPNQCVDARVYNSYSGRFSSECCFEDDCVGINGDYYYAGEDCEYPEDYGLRRCAECGEFFVYDEGCESEITGEEYCCSYCLEEAEESYKEDNWFYSDYDEQYFEDEDDLSRAMQWNGSSYTLVTISIETLENLMDDGEAVEIGGVNYIDAIGFDGEPVHFAALDYANCVA